MIEETTPDRARIAECILALCAARRAGATICPSEAARALCAGEAEWRALMPEVRAVAAALADAGKIIVTQKGFPVDPRAVRGPIRLALASGHAEASDRDRRQRSEQ